MNTKNRQGIVAIAAASTIALAGCQTTGGTQDQMAGAGIGAALGAGVGALITGDARGALTGAAIGGLVGLSVVTINQYQARKVRSSTADTRLYGLTQPVSATQVRIRDGSSSPRTVRAGEAIDISTDYSVMLPSGTSSASVTETWVLKKDGEQVARLPSKNHTREAGGWAAKAQITVPPNTAPGTYVIEHQVKAGSSYDTDESIFIVSA